ncbi:hypothetical protein M0R45_015022 [Rubus argutus]|uniref:Uncharacterized protein n=1 Tax=Rubus argutus TaxID=59490 RepID=A0AAW1XNY3_RUBAR
MSLPRTWSSVEIDETYNRVLCFFSWICSITQLRRRPISIDHQHLIINCPIQSSLDHHTHNPRQPQPTLKTKPQGRNPESGFENWLDQKLPSEDEVDKSKRKYYKKRKSMYGGNSEEEEEKRREVSFCLDLYPSADKRGWYGCLERTRE